MEYSALPKAAIRTKRVGKSIGEIEQQKRQESGFKVF
jgi:hypothetical protein